ncbi:MAG: hypothetical protein WCA35_07390, partial [Kovacikia sp.]
YSLAFHYNTAATISPKVFIFIDDSDKEGSIDPAYVQSFISRELIFWSSYPTQILIVQSG